MDFDGTISKVDVGDELFRTFGNKAEVDGIVQNLLDDKITSRECWTRLCVSIDFININQLDDFILSIEIYPDFHHFVDYCNNHDFSLTILSDGFDYYISKILSREGLEGLKFFSNKLEITSDGRLVPFFPYFNGNCRSLANCKKNHIIENSGENDYTVFIGDGSSDKDTVEYVDFIFAKDDLLKYCERQRITYFPFNNFSDIMLKLNELDSKKKLKKKHQAVLKRREAYLAE